MRSNKKVFLGLNNIAGIFTSLKKGFEQIGVKADFYSFDEHVFGYKTDKIIRYSGNNIIRKFQKFFLIAKLIFKYDYFIFDSSGSLLPGFKDIKLFRKFGKKTMVIFTGCDIRLPEKVERFKWNPCRECTVEYKNFVGCVLSTKSSAIAEIENNFDIRVSPREAAGSLGKSYTETLFPIDISVFQDTLIKKNDKLRIIHAPSNPEYKGTKYILDAVKKLKKEFDFEFNIIKDVKAEELYSEIQKSDLVIDQMLVGFYGLLSIESMAMGKPVVCYIRQDIAESSPAEMPVINADPDSLYDVLKNILMNPEKLISAGEKSRLYAEKYHNSAVIAQKYFDLLENLNK